MSAWMLGGSAQAATFVVTVADDEPDAAAGDGLCATTAGVCTLRAAVDEANALPGLDHVYLSSLFAPYELRQGPLVLSGEVEIAGQEPRFAVIDGCGSSRLLELQPQAGEEVYVRIAGVTLQNGFAGPSDPNGGAVLIGDTRSTLVIERSVLAGNHAVGSGGAIYNTGSVELRRSSVENNWSGLEAESGPAAEGGGIFNLGTVYVARASITGNQARNGAGVSNAAGTMELTNATFSGNGARIRGGAIANAEAASLSLAFGTIAENTATDGSVPGVGGGIYNAGALQLTASIVAMNADGFSGDSPDSAPDCVSEAAPGEPPRITSLGGVVMGVLTSFCGHDMGPGDKRGLPGAPIDPGLAGLGKREFEVTWAYELSADSPAVDLVEASTSCPYLDQWGAARPSPDEDGIATPCDAGAVEHAGQIDRRTVMMVVGDRSFSPTDVVLNIKLHDFGFEVFDESPADLSDEVRERDLTLISETVTSTELPSWLFSVPKPIVSLEPAALDELGMTRDAWDEAQGVVFGESKLSVVDGSPIDVGVRGELEVVDCGSKLSWGVPATSHAFKVAELASAPGRWTIFGYEKGAKLASGVKAPAARVAFFAATDTPQCMNDAGWRLLEGVLTFASAER